jgi:hypothetical protein
VSCERVLGHALRPTSRVEGTFHVHLDPAPWLVLEARTFVADHAPPLPPDTRDAMLLLTSELVTNAVLHARTRLEVGITVAHDAILVTVHDLDLIGPERPVCQTREGGWGLGLVTALAEESALEPHAEGGKTAWFRLPRGDVAEVQDDAAQRPQDRDGQPLRPP